MESSQNEACFLFGLSTNTQMRIHTRLTNNCSRTLSNAHDTYSHQNAWRAATIQSSLLGRSSLGLRANTPDDRATLEAEEINATTGSEVYVEVLHERPQLDRATCGSLSYFLDVTKWDRNIETLIERQTCAVPSTTVTGLLAFCGSCSSCTWSRGFGNHSWS